MKHLPTVNSKSNFAARGIHYAEAANLNVPDEVTDPIQRFEMEIERHKIIDKYLAGQLSLITAAVKMRQMDQIDKLHNIKTEFRNPEIKNFDFIPLEEPMNKEKGKKED